MKHMLAHGILGAAVAAAGDNNALSGGVAAISAEAAAPVISRWLYGKSGSELTAEEKETVAAITRLLGTGAGALAGGQDTVGGAVSGSLSAGNAVGNNDHMRWDGKDPGDSSRYNRALTLLGDPQKARRYLDGQRAGEAQGTEQGLKDLANLPMAYIESIAADAALMKESYGLLPLYAVNKSLAAAEGTRGIYISVQEWQEAYNHALKHDPYTAGLMKGMMDAQIGVHAGAMVVPTGSLVQAGKLSKLGVYLQRAAKTPDAGGTRTSLPRNPSPVDGEMAGGNKRPTVAIPNQSAILNDLGEAFNSRPRVNGSLDASKIPVQIGDKTIMPVPSLSQNGMPIYKGVSDADIFAYYRQLTGNAPNFRQTGKGQLSVGEIKTGDWAGTKIVLRDFSTTQQQTGAKWTIQFQNYPKTVRGTRMELKFQP
ncbi:hypothetical protein L1281_002564 [Neisseria sp. HSC-16F19]|nr:hypothetical protein [Neisseria sp. HSC-16F19]